VSTLILARNGLTERHDSLLRMVFEWSMTPSIAKAVLSNDLCDEETLLKGALYAQATGKGKADMSEAEAAKVLLGFFLMHRSVRRAIAKYLSKTQTMRKGEAMIAMAQLRDQLFVLVEGQIGQA
jgi:hypothetical protein